MKTDVIRADQSLNEPIELLDYFFEKSKRNPIAAYSDMPDYCRKFADDELARCAVDPRYYLENYHVINSKIEGFKTLAPFWDSQEVYWDSIEVYLLTPTGQLKVVVLKARQLGISTVTEGLNFWKTIFSEGCNSLVVAQEQGQADYLFQMCRTAYDYLPWWLRPEVR